MTFDNLLIIPTMRNFPGWSKFDSCRGIDKFDIIIIGEDQNTVPEIQRAYFFGAAERKEWMKDKGLEKFMEAVPEKSRAELNFALVYAYFNGYEKCIIIDDDIEPLNSDFFEDHLALLFDGLHPVAENRWINVIKETGLYPRGYPYNARYMHSTSMSQCDVVLNQGLWYNYLDLNAQEYMTNRMRVEYGDPEQHFVVPMDTYTTVCGMNLSFKTEIAPAFYQFPRKRYDDIWSGLVLKKVLDALAKSMSFGIPYCRHKKFPRSLAKDAIYEMEHHDENEKLWLSLDLLELNGSDYLSCMDEILHGIKWDDDIWNSLKVWVDLWNQIM